MTFTTDQYNFTAELSWELESEVEKSNHKTESTFNMELYFYT